MTLDELESQVWDTELQEYYRKGGNNYHMEESNPATYGLSTSMQGGR